MLTGVSQAATGPHGSGENSGTWTSASRCQGGAGAVIGPLLDKRRAKGHGARSRAPNVLLRKGLALGGAQSHALALARSVLWTAATVLLHP